ncbi:interferon-induced protein 44-like [Polypterus senegalus]|uniref:interferon-induced protein 44-like n=1 Tax=Polypterus senegalus TaxID=55291 RepID=UPI001965C1BF|nr:interferon-induced protein 44-like [Polypterus senegalus]
MGIFGSKGWREVDWSESTRNKLLSEIRNYKTGFSSVEKPRILLVGQVGAGKSSYFNSVNSAYRGNTIFQADVGPSSTSVTKHYRVYPVTDGKSGRELPFIFCDTMGMETEADKGIQVKELINLIKGHIPQRYKFNPMAPLEEHDPRFNAAPSLPEKVHCIVFVVDTAKASSLSEEVVKKITKDIRPEAVELGVPLLVLMTKIDEASMTVKRNLKKVYNSKYIEEQVDKLSQILGFAKSRFLLVQNYSSEFELALDKDILILTALRQILRATDEYFDEMRQRGINS